MSLCRDRALIPLRRIACAAGISLLAAGCAYHPDVCGLRPLSPGLTAQSIGDALEFPETDSLRPTLRWETFPRPSDLKTDGFGLFAGARDVTYEIRIRRADDNVWSPPVYTRKDLPSARHRVEVPLAPDTRYYWSVRAAFRFRGELRTIPWGFSKAPPIPGLRACVLPGYIPEANHFRFRTPPPREPGQ